MYSLLHISLFFFFFFYHYSVCTRSALFLYLTVFIEVVLHVSGIAREVVHGVSVCPLGQTRLGLKGLLQGHAPNLHAVYIHVWI